jgi:5-methylcytosine-specific restriction endonuclease McrA
MQHKLSNHNEEDRTATCSICGPTKMKLRDKTRPLTGRYRCRTVWKQTYNNSVYPYIRHKGTKCQGCGFIPVHISQLDVDHIDGDRWNNDPSNLQTLCANCHRLKTHLSGDSNSGIF